MSSFWNPIKPIGINPYQHKYPGTLGHTTPASVPEVRTQVVVKSNSVPWYMHYGLKPLVGGAVGYGASMMLYPGAEFLWKGTVYSRSAFVFGAVALGLIASEFFHDYVFSHIPKSAKFQHLASEGASIGIVAGVDYLSHVLVSPEVAAEISKTKIALEAAGVVLVTDYVFEHLLLPFWGYELH